MKLLNFGAIALAFCLGGAAQASTITLETFTTAGWLSAAQGGVFEDFEDQTDDTFGFATTPGGQAIRGSGSNLYGELDGGGYQSGVVGQFRTLGGIGTGSSCSDHLDVGSADCGQIALQYDPGFNGQGNALPESGAWSLNSADTEGMSWIARRGDGGMFQRIAFALTDPADNNKNRLDIVVNGSHSRGWDNLTNGETWLAVITLDKPMEFAVIDIRTSLRDGFTLDGAALAPVPLPASVLFLLGGLGMMAAFRRRGAQSA